MAERTRPRPEPAGAGTRDPRLPAGAGHGHMDVRRAIGHACRVTQSPAHLPKSSLLCSRSRPFAGVRCRQRRLPARPERRAELPLTPLRNFLLVPASLDGGTAILVVDTGAEATTVTPETARRTFIWSGRPTAGCCSGWAGRCAASAWCGCITWISAGCSR